MAVSRELIIFGLSITLFARITMAEEFIVGDKWGWTMGFDYQKWAADKVFHVGDKLIFNYPTGKDSVFKVNGTDFQSCTVPEGAQGFTSGQDVIELASAGRRWYSSGVGMHCLSGQKLVITVLPETAHIAPWPAAPAPSRSWLAAQEDHIPHFSRWVPRKLFYRFLY